KPHKMAESYQQRHTDERDVLCFWRLFLSICSLSRERTGKNEWSKRKKLLIENWDARFMAGMRNGWDGVIGKWIFSRSNFSSYLAIFVLPYSKFGKTGCSYGDFNCDDANDTFVSCGGQKEQRRGSRTPSTSRWALLAGKLSLISKCTCLRICFLGA
ncbi:hypothetical protein J6590_025220, partial [Homalodisca vitripennis]